ncbi:MAG: cyclic nucleotide-binding domain-containing protein [Proteobacteria bacterium]|nr:cyclic nucleotide-binding domain-containing protein [Pseudomonadota bacterium]
MQSHKYKVVIVGSGPAGLSAAARAAHYNQEGSSHLLLEAFSSPAKTIFQYQKGKHVMDEPGFLDLRSPMEFVAGKREAVLQAWEDGLKNCKVNIQYETEVVSISGENPNFTIKLKNGDDIVSENVVLSIGLQGNPRKLGMSGDAESNFVRYTLEDPAEFEDKTIVVIGAGDAAIENALGLAQQNTVHIINRKNEFARAKEGNLNAVLAAINNKSNEFYCGYNTNVKSIQLPDSNGRNGAIVLDTPDGDQEIACDCIIARLGAIAPRRFVESCGVQFPNDKPDSIPDLDNQYQSNVKGLYIIGALGGYPLIKQAMNQGYDVIEFIHGKKIKPADHPLLEQQFKLLPYVMDAQKVLELYQQRVPMFRRMNALAFRELIIESNIEIALDEELDTETRKEEELAINTGVSKITKLIKAGDYVFKKGDYSNTFYTIVEGEVHLGSKKGKQFTLKAGQFFGEMGLLSGRPRKVDAVAGSDCILIETPRRIMIKLMNSNDEVAEGINRIFITRALQGAFSPKLSNQELVQLAGGVEMLEFKSGEVVFNEGEKGKELYLIRSGTVSLAKGDAVTVQLQSGDLVGQMALMGNPIRQHTAKATVRVEALKITADQFLKLLQSNSEQIKVLQKDLANLMKKSNSMGSVVEAAATVSFLLDEGLGEATNALVIDESLCVSCDNCETACAETHNGISRLDRASGASFAGLHIPISCRHCEQPHCMKDCPADAIHLVESGEVFIDQSCIGCGNCETNCPYDVIKMSYDMPKKPGLFAWMFMGVGDGPGEPKNIEIDKKAKDKGKKAVKCDACMDIKGGPACVRACPTGAAIRISPNEFVDLVSGR